MTTFKILLSLHSCKDVEEGEENVKYLSKQYPIVGIQKGVSVFYAMAGEQWVQRE